MRLSLKVTFIPWLLLKVTFITRLLLKVTFIRWLTQCHFHNFILAFCQLCVVFCFFHPRHNGQGPPTSKDFLSQILSITFIFRSYFLRKSQYFPYVNKGTTGTIFITSLGWRGPWLGIEPGITRTRCQHSTTRLSRRRLLEYLNTCSLYHVLTSGYLNSTLVYMFIQL